MNNYDRRFLNIREVAEITGLSVSSLYKLTAQGKIPHYKPSGRLLFKSSEILQWVERGRVQEDMSHQKQQL
jgi:excisionase family DNA binding protein